MSLHFGSVGGHPRLFDALAAMLSRCALNPADISIVSGKISVVCECGEHLVSSLHVILALLIPVCSYTSSTQSTVTTLQCASCRHHSC